MKTFKEYQDELKNLKWEGDASSIDIFIHLVEEVGEVAKELRRERRESYLGLKESLADELGDVLGCLTYLANRNGIDLETIATNQIKKLKYREEFGR